ncbi:TPR-like protein [Daldinia decipiens]|uniref:TPR-like protein n=1 Tax=Daldinia decipiens TaxID=326647 RepID=UPI0020C2469A|nr:TPR-like protein [Daldinia decipiens]KAI1660474.1 TPR-like protein [Daldinia decipiens]
MLRQSNRQICPTRSPLEVLYPDPTNHPVEDAEVDIIAVHGLGSNVDWSWTWKDKARKRPPVHWLKDPDMLPALLPRARILVYNYESIWYANAPRTRLQLCGESLMRSVHNFREDSQRPIIFLGHSLGGLVILYGLLYAEGEEELHYLPRQTVGFVSLGTPFRGTQMKWVTSVIAWSMAPAQSHSGIIQDLEYDNSTLRDKVHDLCKLRDRLHLPTCCFFEKFKTDYGKKFGVTGFAKLMVVKEESACIAGWERISLPADHLQMNKYSGPNDSSFLSVSAVIVEMYKKAKVAIESRRSSLDKSQFMVPFGRNSGFVGREQTLQLFLEGISPGTNQNDCQRVVLEGLGGVGKSQLALEAAYRIHEKYPGISVFWVPAISEATFVNAYREIAQQLRLKGLNDNQADIKALTKAALEKENAGKWLFILDNADDVQLLFGDGNTRGLVEYIPFNRSGSILITTRTHEVASRLDILKWDIIAVQEMNERDASKLLQNWLGDDRLGDGESVHDLLELLAYLPLAIKQAAAYIARTGMTTTRYLHHCRTSDSTLIKLLSKNFEDRSRYRDTSNPIATTWLISFEHISRDAPLAAEYLKQLCFFGEKDIPLTLLNQDSELETDEAIGVLKGYAFITERDGTSFDMHRLVRLSMRNWIKEKGNWEEWITQGIKYLDPRLEDVRSGDIMTWRKYLPHTQTALEFQQDAQDKEATWGLLMNISMGYLVLGYYGTAEQTARQSLNLAENIFGHEHPNTLVSINCLSSCLESLGHYLASESLYWKALGLCERQFGPHHPDRLRTMDNLVLALDFQGKLDEEEKLQQQVLEIRKEMLGENHYDTITSMKNLASTLKKLGKYEKAEDLSSRINKAYETWEPGSTNMQQIVTRSKISIDQGMYSEAEEILRQLMDVVEMDPEVNYQQILDAKLVLSTALMKQGRYEEAELQIWELRKKISDEEDLDTIDALLINMHLVECLCKQKKYKEAKPIVQQTLEARKEVLGEEHPVILGYKRILSLVQEYLTMGDWVW